MLRPAGWILLVLGSLLFWSAGAMGAQDAQKADQAVEPAPPRVVIKTINPKGVALEVLVRMDQKDPAGEYQELISQDTQDGQAEFELTPGDYRARLEDRRTGTPNASKEFDLAAGQKKTFTFVISQARLTVKVMQADGQRPAVRVWVERQEAEGSFKEIGGKDDQAGVVELLLSPGTYRVRAENLASHQKVVGEVFTLEEADHHQEELVFP